MLFLLSFHTNNAQSGQEKFKVIGLIVDEAKDPIAFGNAAIYSRTDSSLVTGAISDAEGKFEVSVKPGEYYVSVTFISFEDKIISGINVNNRDVNLGVIVLQTSTDLLNEVVVEGKKEQMILEIDKRVFNVSEDVNNVSRNAADILDNLPSISVDVDGNVSLRGSEGVRILIDGKPSGLVGLSNTDGLRQLQGNIIERIEVITNPSARYEAEGSGGIINIILKKDKKSGLNGGITVNTGYPAEHGLSGNINYRSGRFNLFGNYGLTYDNRPGGGFSDDRFFSNDTSYSTFRSRKSDRGGVSQNFRIGTDFYLTDKDIITASGMFKISDENNLTRLSYDDRDMNNMLVRQTLRRDNETEYENTYEYSLGYKKIFEGEGHELVVDFQYRDNSEIEKSDLEEVYPINPERSDLYQDSRNEEGDKNMLLQVDYVYPFTKDKRMEVGYRGAIREISSNFRVEELNESGIWEPIDGFNNQFIYDENVQAGYLIFRNNMDKWGYQLGLRGENTEIATFQREAQETNRQRYFNLFPSAFVSYKFTKEHSAQVSYSRRISRPRFWFLNPFYNYSDPRNIRAGNPYLNPEYTDSYEVGFLSNLKKTTFYAGVYYRHTTSLMQRITYIEYQPGDTLATSFTVPTNLGLEDAFGIETNFTFDPVHWLHINGNANLYRSIVTGSYEGVDMSRDALSTRFQMATRVSLTKKMELQLRGFYRAPENSPQGRRLSMYAVDFGANWRIMNGKGIVNLSIRDLFNTRRYRGITEGAEFYSQTEFQWRTRQASLSFTYMINPNQEKNGRNGRGGGNGGFDGGDGMDL